MTFVQPQDEQNLQRLLGVGEIPEPVLAEYRCRLEMYHRTGNSGPLGPHALIDLIRFLGLRSPKVDDKPVVIDWRSIPQDGSVRVEGRFFGEWRPGVFLGFVEHGTLAVRFDEDPTIRECQAHMLRLAKSDTLSHFKPDPEDKPDVRADFAAPKVVDPPEQEESEPTWRADMDWSSVEKGAKVWVDCDDDIADGFYVGPGEDGRLIVRVNDRDLTVVPGAVTLVNAAIPVEV